MGLRRAAHAGARDARPAPRHVQPRKHLLRLLPRRQLAPVGCRQSLATRDDRSAQGPPGARRRLRPPRVHPNVGVLRRPPRAALGRWWHDIPGQHGAAVSSPSPHAARLGVEPLPRPRPAGTLLGQRQRVGQARPDRGRSITPGGGSLTGWSRFATCGPIHDSCRSPADQARAPQGVAPRGDEPGAAAGSYGAGPTSRGQPRRRRPSRPCGASRHRRACSTSDRTGTGPPSAPGVRRCHPRRPPRPGPSADTDPWPAP